MEGKLRKKKGQRKKKGLRRRMDRYLNKYTHTGKKQRDPLKTKRIWLDGVQALLRRELEYAIKEGIFFFRRLRYFVR